MTDKSFDPLWVPVLTHYAEGATVRLDGERTADHLRHLTPHVRQYLIAGTTGDSWEMSDDVLSDWIDLARAPDVLTSDHSVLFGAFGGTTEAVIDRAIAIERSIADRPLAASYAGLTICAPVDPHADQRRILDHFQRILAATSSPIAIYQLPQVVKCEIAPESLARLASAEPRIVLFKDTSGNDRVANSGLSIGTTRLLRGAEGDYAAHLKPNGRYDGWLLSTANGLAPQLRSIAEMVVNGRGEQARAASERLTRLVTSLFALADGLPSGNPFSNANRAVDHLNAYGTGWREAPLPRLVSGECLPEAFLASVETLLTRAGIEIRAGYRHRPMESAGRRDR